MAFLFVDSLPKNNSSRMLQISVKALELLLLSAGLISTLVMVKGAVNMPYSCELVFSSLMGFWNSIRCFLSSPLYICIIINFMVLLIAASSSFHRHENEDAAEIKVVVSSTIDDVHDMEFAGLPPLVSPPQPVPSAPPVAAPPPKPTQSSRTIKCTTKTLLPKPNCSEKATPFFFNEAHEIKKIAYPLDSSQDLLEPGKEIDETFTRNPADDEAENEEEEEDTMEATWRAITGGGKEKPKKKQLTKSETLNVPPVPLITSREGLQLPLIPTWKELRKSETFNDAVSITRRGGLRRDPSTSLEDFNKQVEAFIKKFNDNMRLQRQESDQRFLDMIGRGL